MSQVTSVSISVNEIKHSEFLAQFPHISSSINRASFLSIDAEFGGLSLPNKRTHVMDTIQERYQILAGSAKSFPLVQFGLSCFVPCFTDNVFSHYEAITFQFPIFPRYHPRTTRSVPLYKRENMLDVQIDRHFKLQSMCLQYIHEHGFDLNSWVRDGLDYMSRKEFAEIPCREPSAASEIRLTPDMQSFLEELNALIQSQVCVAEFEAESSEEDKIIRAEAFLKDPISDAHTQKAFYTPWLSPFRYRTLCQYLQREEATQLFVAFDCDCDNETREENSDSREQITPWLRRLRIIRVCSKAEVDVFEQAFERIESRKREQSRMLRKGFTSVMDAILHAKKPIVGHNLLLDLLFCFEKFNEPLPEQCGDFCIKLDLWKERSAIYDTKNMATFAKQHLDYFSDKLEKTSLAHVFGVVSKQPFYGPRIMSDSCTQTMELRAHQAGYDAYMTGFVFTRLCSAFRVAENAFSMEELPQALNKFRNKVFLSNFLPQFSLDLDSQWILEPDRSRMIGILLTRVHRDSLRPFHIRQCLDHTFQQANMVVNMYKADMAWQGRNCAFFVLPSRVFVHKLLAMHKVVKHSSGTEADPMPSIGCVDLFSCTKDWGRKRAKHIHRTLS